MLSLSFTNKSIKFLDKCESLLRERITKKITELSINPFPSGRIKLGGEEYYRVRVGDYRILYAVKDKTLLIYKIDKRSRVYD